MKRTYDHKLKLHSKIATKLFMITAFFFTTLLICAMLVQAYYFNHNYVVYKIPDPRKYTDMINEVTRSDMSQNALEKISLKYKNKYEMDSAIFEADRVTAIYISSNNTIFKEALTYYQSKIAESLKDHDNFFQEEYFPPSIGRRYSLAASTHLDNGRVIFVMFPTEAMKTPGLVDTYYMYVFIIGILVSIILSYIFSIMISQRLVHINRIAMNMARLNFNKKIQPMGNDELGQLSNSLNYLSEKLDSTLQELSAANNRLEADIERGRAIEKSSKEFMANASHELKTPLAIIKGYGETLKDNVREDKKAHYLNQIIQQADHMSKLVEDMLALSRMEDGQYQPMITDFDLTMLTQNIIESFHVLSEEKNINIICKFSQAEIKMQADRMKIGQVITNFIQNAIQYTPQNGHISIRILEDQGQLRFEVENEGYHIATEKLNKVWDRFYREEDGRSKKTGGTGLGLAISKMILMAHKMKYGVQNTKIGVLFYFIKGL